MKKIIILGILLTTAVFFGLPFVWKKTQDRQPFFEKIVIVKADDDSFKNNLSASIVNFSGNRLFLAWSASGSTLHNARIVGSFSSDGGTTWTPATNLIDSDLADLDPTIVLTSTAMQVYSTSRPAVPPFDASEMWKTSYSLRHQQWDAVTLMPARHRYEAGRVQEGLRLSDGTLLMPFGWQQNADDGTPASQEGEMISVSAVLRSNDEGKTWQPGNEIFTDVDRSDSKAIFGLGEPAMVQLDNGDLFALFRTGGEKLYQSVSSDGGITWAKAEPSTLTSHNAPAALWRLRGSKEIIVVWNNSPMNRWPLQVALSSDNGRSWSRPRTLSDIEGRQAAYPGITQLPNGQIIVVWHENSLERPVTQIYQARFNRAWLLSEQSQN